MFNILLLHALTEGLVMRGSGQISHSPVSFSAGLSVVTTNLVGSLSPLALEEWRWTLNVVPAGRPTKVKAGDVTVDALETRRPVSKSWSSARKVTGESPPSQSPPQHSNATELSVPFTWVQFFTGSGGPENQNNVNGLMNCTMHTKLPIQN